MSLSLECFYKSISLQKYYTINDNLPENIIEKLFIEKNQTLIQLINIEYERNVVCNVVNKWIDRLNSDRHEKWYGFAHVDYEHVTADMDIVEKFQSINCLLLEKIVGINHEQIISYIYVFCGFDIYYDDFCSEIVYRQDNIKKFYTGKIDDKDFIQYDLIPISEKRKFVDDRVFDEEYNKTIYLSLDNKLLTFFHKLIEEQHIGKISFRSDDRLEDGLIPNNTLCEGVECGTLFNVKFPNLTEKTILFSDLNYNNQLWVFTDENSVTFEELLDDFHCDDNSIVTQMIHLEFFYENGIPYISHIDKENIFYTEEEYEIRLKNNIKGTAKKREKFFKINHSKIKFDYPCPIVNFKSFKEYYETEIPFIYFIVRYFFKNTDVVDEYFSALDK